MQGKGNYRSGIAQSLARQLREPVRARVWAVVIPVFAIYVLLLVGGQRGLPTSEKFRQSVHGLITVQACIERWTAGREQFPLRIESVVGGLQIHSVPVNWYRRHRHATQPMRLVDFGSVDFTGNYSYIPVLDDGAVVGYYLLVYGNHFTPGKDVDNDGRPDHVVYVLSSNSVKGNLMGCWDGREEQLPPLADAIAAWRSFRRDNARLWQESALQPLQAAFGSREQAV